MKKCLAAEHISREIVLRRVEWYASFCHKCFADHSREKSVFWRAALGNLVNEMTEGSFCRVSSQQAYQ